MENMHIDVEEQRVNFIITVVVIVNIFISITITNGILVNNIITIISITLLSLRTPARGRQANAIIRKNHMGYSIISQTQNCTYL